MSPFEEDRLPPDWLPGIEYRLPTLPEGKPRRPLRRNEWIAWGVILASVLAIIFKPHWLPFRRGGDGAVTRVEDERNPQLLMTGRYLVAASGLTRDAGASQAMLKQLDSIARTPVDELRAIMVAGEVAGDKEALGRLDGFEKAHVVVRLRPDVDTLRLIYSRGVGAVSSEQEQALVARHQWFGELATTHGLGRDHAARGKVLGAARRVFVIYIAAALGGILVVLAGVAVFIIAIVMRVKKKLPTAFVPWIDERGVYLETFAIYLVAMVLLSLGLSWVATRGALWPSFVLVAVLPISLGWLLYRGERWVDICAKLGLHRGRGIWREMAAGWTGYLAGVPIIVAGMIVTLLLMKVSGARASHPIADMPMEKWWQVLPVFLLAAVQAPVLEEMLFRGALLGHLRGRFGWVISTLVVSVIFASIHPQGWAGIPALAAIAIVLAGIREWRGSLIGPMVMHATNNGLLVILMALTMR